MTREKLIELREAMQAADDANAAYRAANTAGRTAVELVELDIAARKALLALVDAKEIYRRALDEYVAESQK
jgi:hypothetical protein